MEGIAALLLYYFKLVYSYMGMLIITLASIWLIGIFFIPLLRRRIPFNPFHYFMRINYYVLLIVVILIADHLFVEYFG